jgi:hypothetical protein
MVTIISVNDGKLIDERHYLSFLGARLKTIESEFLNEDSGLSYFVGNIAIDHRLINANANVLNQINNCIEKSENDFICIIPPGIYLQVNWLEELMYFYKNIDLSGVVGILDSFENTSISPLPSNDLEFMQQIFEPNSNVIEGLMFFSKKKLSLIGALDNNNELSLQESFAQFMLRVKYSGLFNYYIPTLICVLCKQNTSNRGATNNYYLKNSISEMRKRNIYYIPFENV